MKTNTYLLVSFLLFFLIACSKKEDETPQNNSPCQDFHSPYVSNNGPVQEGQSVQLFADTDEDDVTFQWTGPNNFSSTQQNPVINNIPFNCNGSYYVQMKGSQCEASQASTFITVTAPCDLNDNQGTFNNQIWNFYSSIACGNNGPNGTYLFNASGANGTLDIYFNKLNKPTGYIKYPVDGTGNPVFDSTKVQMKLTTSASVVFNAISGTVYIGNDGSLLFASFCTAIFYNSSGGISWTGSKAKIICQ